MRTLHGALLVALAARSVLAGGANPLLVPAQRDEGAKYGKRKVARAVYARQEESESLLHSSHASSHSSHASHSTQSSHSSHHSSSHTASHSSHLVHSSSSHAHSSHSSRSVHSSSSHSAHSSSRHSSSSRASSAPSSRQISSRSSSSTHSTAPSSRRSSSVEDESSSSETVSSASSTWEMSSVEASSSTITSAPSSASSFPLFDGGSSVVEEDILDNDYDAMTDDHIWATVTNFPPQNGKARTVAAGSGVSGASGPVETGASSSWGSSSSWASSAGEASSTDLAKRAHRPPLLKKPTTSTRKPTTTKAAAIVTTKYAISYLALGTGTCPTFVGVTKVASPTGSSSWPAPSRSSVSCRPAPSTFAGTNQGFADLCNNVRYCDPPVTQKYTTSSLTGDVTRTEIETLLGQLQNVGSVLQVGTSTNTFSTGWAGQGAYGSGLLFEVTGDIRALDNAVRIADNILAMRNNPSTGRVMWTGKRELVWITKPAGKTGQLYAGSENMSIIGNMVNAAIYILRNPCLWERRPQWTNAPTTFTRTSTYLDRAKAYVAAADQTMDSYFRPYWFNSGGIMIQPNSSLYSKAQDFPPGTFVPWNRRALMLHGLIRLATVHELAPLQDPVRVKRYDDLAAANVRDFVNNLLPTRSRGYQTYVWYYGQAHSLSQWFMAYGACSKGSTRGTIEMVRGVHGYYDAWGMWIAWQRGLAPETLTNTVMQNLANTMQHAIYSEDSDKLFAAYVNGYANICNADEQPIKYVWGAYAFFGRWIPSWYTQVAQAGQAQLKLTWVTAPLFWAKAANFRNTDSFWRATSYT